VAALTGTNRLLGNAHLGRIAALMQKRCNSERNAVYARLALGLRVAGLRRSAMPLAREKVAAYHRAYRARKKAEARAAEQAACRSSNVVPMVRADAALPKDAIAKASPAELAAVRADIAALGERGAVITQIGGRLRAVEPKNKPPARVEPPTWQPRTAPISNRAQQFPNGAQRGSMIASGGTPPGPPVKASIAEATADLRARLAMHARAIEELTRRDREKETRLAALEAQAAVRPASWADAIQQAVVALARKP
jgi:hypothetical protein